MKEFTPEELAKFDGAEGRAAYVAMNGKVYDVSESKLWKTGRHMNKHAAGGDLSGDFPQAPHGDEVFERVALVGAIKSAPPAREIPRWADFMLGFHPHPILVHFPQAFFTFAPVFLALFALLGNEYFERTAYYLLLTGLLTGVPAYFAGIFHWKYKYGGSVKFAYIFKIAMSAVLIAYSAVLFVIHTSRGALGTDEAGGAMLAMYLILIPIAASIGHVGGAIVFGGRKK